MYGLCVCWSVMHTIIKVWCQVVYEMIENIHVFEKTDIIPRSYLILIYAINKFLQAISEELLRTHRWTDGNTDERDLSQYPPPSAWDNLQVCQVESAIFLIVRNYNLWHIHHHRGRIIYKTLSYISSFLSSFVCLPLLFTCCRRYVIWLLTSLLQECPVIMCVFMDYSGVFMVMLLLVVADTMSSH